MRGGEKNMPKPLTLLFNVEPNRKRQIETLAAIHGIRVRAVAAGEFGKSVGALCGLEDDAGAQGLWSEFGEEMMVMAFFTEELLHRFLDGFRQVGIPSVRLKAVLTETNGRWSPCRLRAELLKEEAAFRSTRNEKRP